MIVVTKRDRSKAVEFLNMMKRVAPPMGIEVWRYGNGGLGDIIHPKWWYPLTFFPLNIQIQDAQVIEVPNDRTDTYLQAIRPQIIPSLQLVVIVFPTSRDDR